MLAGVPSRPHSGLLAVTGRCHVSCGWSGGAVRRWGRVACVMRRLWSPLARSDTLKKSSCVSLGTTSISSGANVPFSHVRERLSDSRRVRPRLRIHTAGTHVHTAHISHQGFNDPTPRPDPARPHAPQSTRDERRVLYLRGLYFFVSPPPGPNPRRTSRLAVTSNARLTAHGDRESRGSRACSRDVGSRVKPYDRHESPT